MHTRTALAARLIDRHVDRTRVEGEPAGEGGSGGGDDKGGDEGTPAGSPTVQFGPDGVVQIIPPGGGKPAPAGDGGRPGVTLAEQIAATNARIDELTGKEIPKAIDKRQEGKEAERELAAQVEALTGQVKTLIERQGTETVADAARAAGARDPFAVAKLVGDATDPAAVIAAMKGDGTTQGSHAYMFGAAPEPGRRPSADLGGGETPGGGESGAKTPLGKYIADEFLQT